MQGKLTRRAVEALRHDPKRPSQQILWDTELTGFGCRVFPSGRKAWVVSYRWPRGRAGRARLFTIAPVSLLPIEQARERARLTLLEAYQGNDPAAVRASERAMPTFAALCTKYLQATAATKLSHRADAQRVRDYLAPTLGRLRADSISRADIARLHARISAEVSSVLANRCLALASAIFAWASTYGELPEGHANPCRVRGLHAAEISRERFLTRDEVRRLLVAVEDEPNPYVRGLIWLGLLTGCRKGELLGLRWDESVDLGARLLRLGRTKNGRPFTVELSSPAVAVLMRLPRQTGDLRVFPARGERLSVAKRWYRIRKAAGIADVRLHDLRRTLGSWRAESGDSQALIGALLNHSSPEVTKVYTRLSDGSRRKALEAHGAAVLEAYATKDAAEAIGA